MVAPGNHVYTCVHMYPSMHAHVCTYMYTGQRVGGYISSIEISFSNVQSCLLKGKQIKNSRKYLSDFASCICWAPCFRPLQSTEPFVLTWIAGLPPLLVCYHPALLLCWRTNRSELIFNHCITSFGLSCQDKVTLNLENIWVPSEQSFVPSSMSTEWQKSLLDFLFSFQEMAQINSAIMEEEYGLY